VEIQTRQCHKDGNSSPACRHNFEEDTERELNRLINIELEAGYMYQAMAFYFDRADVALTGFSQFFRRSADEERQHAEQLMGYMNLRGGGLQLVDVKACGTRGWTPVGAMEEALHMEKKVTDNLLLLHNTAESMGDVQTCDYLEGQFLSHQAEAVKQLADHVTRVRLAGPGLGVWLYSKELEDDKGMH